MLTIKVDIRMPSIFKMTTANTQSMATQRVKVESTAASEDEKNIIIYNLFKCVQNNEQFVWDFTWAVAAVASLLLTLSGSQFVFFLPVMRRQRRAIAWARITWKSFRMDASLLLYFYFRSRVFRLKCLNSNMFLHVLFYENTIVHACKNHPFEREMVHMLGAQIQRKINWWKRNYVIARWWEFTFAV